MLNLVQEVRKYLFPLKHVHVCMITERRVIYLWTHLHTTHLTRNRVGWWQRVKLITEVPSVNVTINNEIPLQLRLHTSQRPTTTASTIVVVKLSPLRQPPSYSSVITTMTRYRQRDVHEASFRPAQQQWPQRWCWCKHKTRPKTTVLTVTDTSGGYTPPIGVLEESSRPSHQVPSPHNHRQIGNTSP